MTIVTFHWNMASVAVNNDGIAGGMEFRGDIDITQRSTCSFIRRRLRQHRGSFVKPSNTPHHMRCWYLHRSMRSLPSNTMVCDARGNSPAGPDPLVPTQGWYHSSEPFRNPPIRLGQHKTICTTGRYRGHNFHHGSQATVVNLVDRHD